MTIQLSPSLLTTLASRWNTRKGDRIITDAYIVDQRMIDNIETSELDNPATQYGLTYGGSGTMYLLLLEKLMNNPKLYAGLSKFRKLGHCLRQLWYEDKDQAMVDEFVGNLRFTLQRFWRLAPKQIDSIVVYLQHTGRIAKGDSMKNKYEFDVEIINPPYESGLYLGMLVNACERSEHVIAIHPAEVWTSKIEFVEGKPKSKRNTLKLRKVAQKGLVVDFIENPWPKSKYPQKGAHVRQASGICISSISDLHQGNVFVNNFVSQWRGKFYTPVIGLKVNSPDDIHWGYSSNGSHLMSALRKIQAKIKTIGSWNDHLFYDTMNATTSIQQGRDKLKVVDNGESFLCFPRTRQSGDDDKGTRTWWGTKRYIHSFNMFTKSSFAFAPKSDGIHHTLTLRNPSKGTGGLLYFSFPNTNHHKNAKDFWYTGFTMALSALLKRDRNGGNAFNTVGIRKMFPWMDWSQSWNTSKLYRFFEFDDNEIAAWQGVIDDLEIPNV